MTSIFIDLLKPFLEEIIKNIDSKQYGIVTLYIAAIIIILISIGYIISFILNKKKVKKEIEKLSVEAKAKQISLLETLQTKRATYHKQLELLQLSVKLCIESLEQGEATTLKQNREELIDLFYNKLFNNFVEYIEVSEIFYKGEQQRLNSYIYDEILPFLDTVSDFQQTINFSVTLSILKTDAVKIQRFTLRPIIRFTKAHTPFYNLILKHNIKKTLGNIAFEN